MRSAILWELGRDLEVRDDVSLGELGPRDVHVKVASSGVCHSDLSVQNGTIPSPLPGVLGHEGAGVVLEVGAEVTRVAPGDHVIAAFTPACRSCKPCLRGQSYLCEQMQRTMTSAPFRVDGKPIFAFAGLGTFSEEMIALEDAVIRVEPDIPLNVVSLVGCCVTTGVGAAINTARVVPGSSVVVFGCGGVGISAIQGARIAGAAEIVAVDTVASKREGARRFGATHAVAPDQINDAKQEITGGEGFDYALECVGHPDTIRGAYDAVRRGGTAVIVGAGRFDHKIEFNAFELFFAEKTLRGSMYGSANVHLDFERLLRLWRHGKLDLEGMITRRIKLDEVNEAFRAMQAGEVIRSVIEF